MRTTVVLALAALLAVSAAMPTAAQDGGRVLPGLGIRLLEVPADRADDPRANTYIVDHVEPGTVIERRIAVSNGTDAPLPVELYGVAATVADGWVVQDGEGGNELAEWISVEPSSRVLQPGQVQEVLARIEVPADASGGERYAAIVAATEGEGGGTVEVTSRVGIRVYLSVAGEVAPVEEFEISTLTGGREADGAPYVLVGVANTGDRAIDAAGDLRLEDGPGALSAGPFDVALPRTIGPGDEAELRVPLDPSLPEGPWLATAELSSGLVERQAQATITFPESGTGDAVPAEALGVADDDARLLPPIVGLVGLGLLALVLLVLLLLRRRRRGGADHEEGRLSEPTEVVDEGVRSPPGPDPTTGPASDESSGPAPPWGPPPAPAPQRLTAPGPQPPTAPAPGAAPPHEPPRASAPIAVSPPSPQVPTAPSGGTRPAPVAPPAPPAP